MAQMALRQDGIARGSYPRERPDLAALAEPDPFTGRLIAYRPGDDGSLRLEVQGAAKLVAVRWLGPFRGGEEPPDWVKHHVRAHQRHATISHTGPPQPDHGRING